MITLERVKELLHYEPTTGIFTWKCSRGNNRIKAGSRAGSVYPTGYRFIGIDNTDYAESRLAWLYVHGVFPTQVIDHIDGYRDNNRISNLRDVSQADNVKAFRTLGANNKTGFTGVGFFKRDNRYRAYIGLNNKFIHLGYFDTAEEASIAYQGAKLKLHFN